jgi:hypothetical protein
MIAWRSEIMAKKKPTNTFIEIDYSTEATPRAVTPCWGTSSKQTDGEQRSPFQRGAASSLKDTADAWQRFISRADTSR